MLLMGEVDCAPNERQRHWAPPCGRRGPFHCGRRSVDGPYHNSYGPAFFQGRRGSRVPPCPDLDAEPVESESRLRRCERIHGGGRRGCHPPGFEAPPPPRPGGGGGGTKPPPGVPGVDFW